LREGFVEELRCPACGDRFHLEARERAQGIVVEGALQCACGRRFPIILGIPRLLPPAAAASLRAEHPDFFRRHPDLEPSALRVPPRSASLRTQRAFGDEWRRFPELLRVHERIFEWYFQGGEPSDWPRLRVLDAGCGMGRWLHFARKAGARVVGLDVSRAIEVAAARERDQADLVQADLRRPPFAAGTFDLVYSLGVVHHLEDPGGAVATLARLLVPGGQLRLYVYRSLAGDPWLRRALLAVVTNLRAVTTRLPYPVVHALAISIAATASVAFLAPRRLLRGTRLGDRVTAGLPLVQYADVPFQMLVGEQFDRLVAPIEGRYAREEVEEWLVAAGLAVVEILPELGWRAIAVR
jgi:SAM-dependent methyltransferase